MPQRPPTIGARPRITAPTVARVDRRPSSAARGYGARWQRAAALHLAQNPLCARCLTVKRSTLAELVDHIRPVQGANDPGFFDPDNHQSLCCSCHTDKTHADKRAGNTRKF